MAGAMIGHESPCNPNPNVNLNLTLTETLNLTLATTVTLLAPVSLRRAVPAPLTLAPTLPGSLIYPCPYFYSCSYPYSSVSAPSDSPSP